MISKWPLLVFALCLVAEFLVFDRVGAKHQTWIYPRWNDQIQYLTESYTGYEDLKLHGLGPGLWHALTNPSAQGTLHDFFAVALFTVAGPSRSAALALNLLALILWQGSFFLAVARTTGSRSLAWIAGMLPLALQWPWNDWAGSTIDFRLDHMAMCAIGTTLACGLLTRGFLSRGWSLAFGAAVGLTLLLRFLTGTYFLLIFFGLLGFLLASASGRKRRICHLLLAAAVAALLAGPIFWLNRLWVWNYYWIGHFTGPESALRNPHMGIGRSLAFVWGHLFRDHLGSYLLWLIAAGTAFLLAALARPGRAEDRPPPFVPPAGGLLGGLFLAAPALILTLHQQKSEIVVGALVPGALLLVIVAWAELHRRSARAWTMPVLAAGVAAAAAAFFVSRQAQRGYDDDFAADARKINTLADYIFTHARDAGLKEPRVGVDQITDCLDGQVLRVICYERHGVWVPFIMTLPTGIAEEKPALLLERLAQSDFVFLTEGGPMTDWPYDHQMRALLPQTQAWCESHLRFVERFTVFGRRMILYQRPEIP
jgi:hypothetical protein